MQEILENAIPITLQDVTLIFCTVSGWIDGKLTQRSNARKIYNQVVDGDQWSSIQVTTAAGICAVVDLVGSGEESLSGFLKQESVSLEAFLKNRFGQYYASGQVSTDPEVKIETLTDFYS